jgi:hypothetical protein
MDSSRPCTFTNIYIYIPCDGSCDKRPGFSTLWPAVPTSDGTGQARQSDDAGHSVAGAVCSDGAAHVEVGSDGTEPCLLAQEASASSPH